jgi:hypothetical protein
MGNFTFSILRIFEYSFQRTASEDLETLKKKVVSVEERCDGLEFLQDPRPGFRSFLLMRTKDNCCIRVDYPEGSVEPLVTFNYRESLNCESFRYSLVKEELTLEQALEIIRKHSVKLPFQWNSHNSQHVCLDSFREMTGIHTFLLRNDYLRWRRQRFHSKDKKDAHERDSRELIVKKWKKELGPELDSEKIENFYGPRIRRDSWEMFEFAVHLASVKYWEKFMDPGFKEIRKKIWKRAERGSSN